MSLIDRNKGLCFDSIKLAGEQYKDPSLIAKRKALYQFTTPRHDIDAIVLAHLSLKREQRMLDVGCGEGKIILQAASLNPNATFIGLDVSLGMFKDSLEKTRGLPNIHFEVGDVQRLNFPDKSFDRVAAIHMLYHVTDIESAIAEMARVQKTDGFTLITTNSLKSKPTLRLLKTKALKLLNRDDFPDLVQRFNIEMGGKLLRKYYSKIKMIPYESLLVLHDPQPYVDYFDSIKEFWMPRPSEDEWRQVLTMVRDYINQAIEAYGQFQEINLFGVFLASQPKL